MSRKYRLIALLAGVAALALAAAITELELRKW